MNEKLTENLPWGAWVTPKNVKEKPIHRWYFFPHSFTSELVHALIDEWSLGINDRILDPFSGAGTTLLAAKEKGVASDGYDLSPLAVLASNTKSARFSRSTLETGWYKLKGALAKFRAAEISDGYPELVKKALPDGRLEELDAVSKCIDSIECSTLERDFFRLALIAILPRFSQAVANGGWLRWLNDGAGAENVRVQFIEQVELMLADLHAETGLLDACDSLLQTKPKWEALVADARSMPASDAVYSAVITSPPYPNRHDYTRIFGVELMFGFQDWEANRALRYQMFHSHPEARPNRPKTPEYKPPEGLRESVCTLSDRRIQRMLDGYFLDMYLCLCEVARVCQNGARAAIVVGNAQYGGKPILVDEFTAEIGEQVGLSCNEIRVVRWRGNSAQQMGEYGRMPARESLVLFEKN